MTLIKILIAAMLVMSMASGVSAETFGAVDTVNGEVGGFGWTNCRMNPHANHTYTASAGDVVTGFSFLGESIDGGNNDTIGIVLYNITSGVNGSPIEGTAAKIALTSTTMDWYHVTGLSISLTADSTYAIAAGSEVGAVAGYRTSDGFLTSSRAIDAVATLPATFGSAIDGNRFFWMYATYTPGAAAAGQVIMINE